MAGAHLTDWHRSMAASIAAPMVPTTPIRASGNHLVAAQDEPEPREFSEEELVEADLAYLRNQQQRDARRLHSAIEQQVDHLRTLGGL